ncbi:MAG TPA: hypothetical protein VE129_09625 [Thermoanaerobaculia bacterium]|nr:hypothetical protein [Thermoanaerobaculia bacterium]
MSIAVRFVSGSLIDREFSFPKEFVRIGDAEGVDLRVDPAQPGDGGARGRVIEISEERDGLRVRSAGDRELSAQGEFPLDHLVAEGAEVRFGAWGPVFTVRHFSSEASRTAPLAVFDDSASRRLDESASRRPDDSASRRRVEDTASRKGRNLLTASGEKPVGPKTVMIMIQDALSKAREQGDAGFVEKGTVFVREVVSDTIQSATRSLKIGLLLTGAALVVLAFALGFNVWKTRQTVERVTRAADESVQGVRKELGGRVDEMRAERDALAAESAEVARKIGVLEKTAGTSQEAVKELRGRLSDADVRRKDLEGRMQRALTSLEADKAALQRQLAQMEKDRAADRARQQEEMERLRREAAAPPAQPVEPAPTPVPVPR